MKKDSDKWSTITYKSVRISFKTLKLTLKRVFNTAHSSSTHRNNFLIRVSDNKINGYGECGLPPKRAKCYLADIKDCEEFMNILQKKLDQE